MNYEHYSDPYYNSEGDINYTIEDNSSLLGGSPAHVYTHSDGFYDDEIENSAYMRRYLIPSLNLCSFIFPIS